MTIDSIPSLKNKRDFIALEAMTSVDIQSLLANVFPSILAGFTSFANHFMPAAPGIKLNTKQNDFIRCVETQRYSDLSPLGAFVPEGLQVSYLEYITALKPAVDHAVLYVFKGLNEFSMLLAQIINTEEAKFNSRSFKQVYTTGQDNRGKINTELGNCFLKGSTRSELTYKDVVKRNTDWIDVLHLSDMLVDEINKVDRTALNKKVKEIVEYLNIIQDKIKREEFKGAFPTLAENVADGTFQIASELEFYAAIYYKVLALQESIQATVKRVNDIVQAK